jgi:hypothetical protein
MMVRKSGESYNFGYEFENAILQEPKVLEGANGK